MIKLLRISKCRKKDEAKENASDGTDIGYCFKEYEIKKIIIIM